MKNKNDINVAIVHDEVPPFDVFIEEIKNIYPEGDMAKTYNRIKWFIENEQVCEDGTPITYRLIMDQFAAHINQWNTRYRKKELAGYLHKKADEKRKNLYEFLGLRLYEQIFMMPDCYSDRDQYIFGPFKITELVERLADFQKTFPNEQQESKTTD